MDIEIFPHRVLGPDTTEKLLNSIEGIDDVKRTVIQGSRLPPIDDTLPSKFQERRVIVVNGKEVQLKVKTGRIFVELSMESTIDEIESICKEHLPFGFDINQDKSQYIRKQETVSDRMKYGDKSIPEDLIGMTDQHSRFSENVSIIRRDDME